MQLPGGQRREDWSDYPGFLDADGLLEHGLGGFLVRTGGHTVLIDTGVGPDQIGPYGPYDRVIKGGELPTRLAELGVEPADVTDIVLTHLHPDHYGWATHDAARLSRRRRSAATPWTGTTSCSSPALSSRAGRRTCSHWATASSAGPRRPPSARYRCSARTRAHPR